jgi:hypothetical protein
MGQAIFNLLPRSATENIMAKKTTRKPAPTAKKKAAAKTTEPVEIELDPIETKAFELAQSSAKVRKELEETATLAMSQAVRKVFKQHRISLTAEQSHKVAAFLFCD